MTRLANERPGIGAEVVIEAPFRHLAPHRLELGIARAIAKSPQSGLRRQHGLLVDLPFAAFIPERHKRTVALHVRPRAGRDAR